METHSIIIDAYDPGAGDIGYNLNVIIHDEDLLDTDQCIAVFGLFLPASENGGIAEIHLGKLAHDDFLTIAHECLHAAFDLIRFSCHVKLGDLIVDNPESPIGEECVNNTFHNILVKVLESLGYVMGDL